MSGTSSRFRDMLSKPLVAFKNIVNEDIVWKERFKEFVHVGDYTYGTPKVLMWTDTYHLRIGKFCSIAQDVMVILDGNHHTDWISSYPFTRLFHHLARETLHGKGDVVIGNDVWIGANVVILPGVHIGDGAVVGCSSVVSKDVDDYEVVAGNPANHVRLRFPPDQIALLKEVRWWDWPIDKIRDNVSVLQSLDVERLRALKGR